MATEIIRRTARIDLPDLTDNELILSANELFLELDQREQADEHPKRSEVWLVDLGYAAKIRPCLVLSIPVLDQDRALVTLVPHTTSSGGSRFEVALPLRLLKPGVFDAQNLVTIPDARLMRKPGELSTSHLATLETAMRLWLGL